MLPGCADLIRVSGAITTRWLSWSSPSAKGEKSLGASLDVILPLILLTFSVVIFISLRFLLLNFVLRTKRSKSAKKNLFQAIHDDFHHSTNLFRTGTRPGHASQSPQIGHQEQRQTPGIR